MAGDRAARPDPDALSWYEATARQRVLASIEADFAESVLGLSAGDASHPNSNGTVKDNVDEANAAAGPAVPRRRRCPLHALPEAPARPVPPDAAPRAEHRTPLCFRGASAYCPTGYCPTCRVT